MATANAAAFVLGTLTCEQDGPPIDFTHARRYEGITRVGCEVRNAWKFNFKRVIYEILPRPSTTSATSFTQNEFDKTKPESGGLCFSLLTPESIRMKLLANKFKHSYTPSWERFDFGSMVFHLGAWLAYCTWNPTAPLSAMSKKKDIKLLGMNNPEETCGLNDDRVYINQSVSTGSHAATFWALAWAAAASGSAVLTDYVTLDGSYAARAKDYSGGQAWFGAVEAAAILAEYYSQAGSLDVFATFFFAGLHSVSTVVGHSDEGGIMRDIFRRVRVGHCYGGLPRDSVRSNSIPSLAVSTCYQALTSLVDSYTLLSAAAVAHCDPLSALANGEMYPTILDCGNVIGLSNRVALYGSILDQGFPRFAQLYIGALTKLIGGSANDVEGRGAAVLSLAATEFFAGGGSRHLDYPTLAPYFWIEPTGLIPKNFFGTPAEACGWASYGAGSEKTTLAPFERMERSGVYSDYRSDWIVKSTGIRKSGLVLFLQDHPNDGLACVTPIQFDSSNICMTGCTQSEGLRLREGANLSQYLWKRGQSGFPHPAEFINTAGTMMIKMIHYTSNADGVKYTKNLPCSADFESTVYHLTFHRAQQVAPGPPNQWTSAARRERKQATEALTHAASIFGVVQGEPLVANTVADCAPAFSKEKEHPKQDCFPAEGTMASFPGDSVFQQTVVKQKRAAVVAPTIIHEALHGPQLARADTKPQGSVVVDASAPPSGTLTGIDTAFRSMPSSAESSTVIPVANVAGDAPSQGAQPAAQP